MQKTLFRYWLILWLLAACLLAYPINALPLRIGLIVSLVGVWAGCFFFGRRNKFFTVTFVSLTILIGGFLVCPGRDYDRSRLRDTYVSALRTYEGTRYIWGGENKLGIDCSGLVRAALIKADFQQGVLTLNPKLMRMALSLWSHDLSAKALGEEHRQQTKRLLTTPSINRLDQNQLMPGDIAVTRSGIHVLACLGAGEWIEADPNFNKVIIVKIPAVQNPWFEEPVQIMRWTQLETN